MGITILINKIDKEFILIINLKKKYYVFISIIFF